MTTCCDDDDFPHEVVLYPSTGHNGFGEQTHGPIVKLNALIDPPSQSMRRVPSQEHESTGTTIIVQGLQRIDTNDKLRLPDGTETIVQAVQRYDFDSPEMAHSVVTVE